ncbi:MAG: hypothetical protein ACYDCK_11300 [Thermoplasmatota archaeon]
MSFLIDPFLLLIAGAVGARLARTRLFWKRDSFFLWYYGAFVLASFYFWTLSLIADAPYTRWMYAPFGSANGLDFMVNSGVFHIATAWPIASAPLLAFIVVAHATYPLFLWIGIQLGYMMFGRAPWHTGAVGLLWPRSTGR